MLDTSAAQSLATGEQLSDVPGFMLSYNLGGCMYDHMIMSQQCAAQIKPSSFGKALHICCAAAFTAYQHPGPQSTCHMLAARVPMSSLHFEKEGACASPAQLLADLSSSAATFTFHPTLKHTVASACSSWNTFELQHRQLTNAIAAGFAFVFVCL